jgi:hypothetical protein
VAERAAGLNKAIGHQYITLRRLARKKPHSRSSRQRFSSAALRPGHGSNRGATPPHGSPGAMLAAWFAPATRIVPGRRVRHVEIGIGAVRFMFFVACISHQRGWQRSKATARGLSPFAHASRRPDDAGVQSETARSGGAAHTVMCALPPMFKLITTMRRGSATGVAAAWARYPSVAAARLGVATLLRDDRVLRVMIVRNEIPPAFVEWVER